MGSVFSSLLCLRNTKNRILIVLWSWSESGNFRSPLVIVFEACRVSFEFSRVSCSLSVDWKTKPKLISNQIQQCFCLESFILMYQNILFLLVSTYWHQPKEKKIFFQYLYCRTFNSCNSVISTVNNILSPIPCNKTLCFLCKIIKQVGRRLWSTYLVTVA